MPTRLATLASMCGSSRLRQEVLEDNVADDVETGLAAPSQGQTR